ncbi:hypothetical protein POM88_020127 [Heracleum sosnowskyi]|uniref:Uncharacterized protein n=1 Tax=Heracleum sosnowskyi TaxID=360622 RepID=A0AAD8ID99_9APIA|nr:hypothetical protein POM88_020127 [Heracleum sosnowskyi]
MVLALAFLGNSASIESTDAFNIHTAATAAVDWAEQHLAPTWCCRRAGESTVGRAVEEMCFYSRVEERCVYSRVRVDDFSCGSGWTGEKPEKNDDMKSILHFCVCV